ncbi:MAG: pyridoxal-phosphate dependent enzyme, partial [Candidatus Latescibacteria bacterium]|nr:pyridoxal-phosphate dependent enzyme [Candidatus Latescibacterota bacterium]
LGFSDLLRCGCITNLPRLVAVQASACAPLHRLWSGDAHPQAEKASCSTIAEGIAIAEPTRASQILDAVRHTGGQVVTVTDEEVESALTGFCRGGWYIEPTSATALAGLSKSEIGEDETVVVPLTGHGLKSTEKLIKLAAS